MSYSKQNFRSGDTLYASQLNAMDDEIAVLEAEVESTKNMVGSPLTASTAAGMTDQTKIYVYTGSETGYTAGHWYYYNGTAWTDGGVYNSVAVNTDTSLTVSGQAADSKAVGDAIDDLDSDLSDVKSDLNGIYEQINTNVVFNQRNVADCYTYANRTDYVIALEPTIACVMGDVVNISGSIEAVINPSNWSQLGLRINELDANDTVLLRTNLTSWNGETDYAVSQSSCEKISINLYVTRKDTNGYTEKINYNIVARIGTNILDTFASASDVDSLRFAIDGINTGYAPIEPELTNGSINASTGEDTATDYTKTKGYVSTDDADIVDASQNPRNIYVYVHYYNYSNDSYVWQTSVTNRNSLNTPITINKSYDYFRVVGYYNTSPYKIPLDSFYDVVYIAKKYNSEQIDSLTARVTALDDGSVIPSYWQTHIEQKVSDISAKNLLIGSNGVNFIFLTDTHIQYNSLASPSLIRYILKNTVISKVVNGGDWINLDSAKSTCIARLEQWNKLMNGVEEIRIRGNHDLNNFNGTNTANQLTIGEYYALMDRPMETFVNTEGKTYFVVDNESQKFRLVILDSELYNSSTMWNAEMTWMKSRLTELDSEWAILVMQHTLYGTTEGVLAPVGQDVIDNINEVYSSINASFIGILAGHSHTDYNATEPTNGYALIVTNCDTLDGNYSGLDRTSGTITEQSFDVVSIDFANRKIYMTRIGAGTDREISY